MNILAWNVHGLAAPPAQHEFLRILRSTKATIAFAIDTKLNTEQLQKFQFKLPDKCLISNIHISGPWARIIALWDPLKVTLQNCAPIICMGDFNAVLNSHEKTGRAPALQACLAFPDFVSQSALTEVSCPDAKFTWTNNWRGHENVKSKIDGCFVSKEWVDDTELMVLLEVHPRSISDHNPILLCISKRRLTTWGRTPFRHFQYWQDMAGYRDQVMLAWTEDTRGCAMINLIQKLETTMDKLKIWCKGGANDLPHQIVELKSKIKLLQSLSESGHLEAIDEECNLKRGIANGRRWRNKIASISHDGWLLTEMPDIFTTCTDYFPGLLGTSHGTGNLSYSLAPGPIVSTEENADLLKPLTAVEIQWAVMDADRDSAPGPDGFGNSFFQRNWDTVQKAVAGAIRGFFDSERLVKSINKTHIILLPKEQGAMQVDKLQPISLCTSTMKFITRIMVQRMRPILNKNISKNQSTFLSGRCIQNSFLLSQEIVHILQNSKKQAAYVKIDLSKAYDRVNWGFLKAALCHLGFQDLWIQKVMTIVTLVRSALLINGKEGTWIQAYINSNQIKIPSMGAGPTSPFSMLYAEDIIFFIDGRLQNLRRLKVCLDEFFSCSGLVMNIAKSSVLSFNMNSQELS
ncbi:uncharacterized protein LOC116255258 [Nymphaea colorata]|uniref:uncharacterized protein LOC116255258 n=1 Tax=Nymphaea colorata TaxID=210225 RepID=UPI00129DE405|nr:uncharacterized protein LOC116255258 [Nymphaea colorata]